MAQAAVYLAFADRLEIFWDRCPVLDGIARRKPPADGGPFLALQFPVSRSEQISIGTPGANVFRETGVCRLVLSVPAGVETPAALAWADDLAALFRSRRFDGVETDAPDSSVLSDAEDAGAYAVLSVLIPYTFDFTA